MLKIWNASRICVSSLRGHANLLCIVPILVYVLPKQYVSGGQQQLFVLSHHVLRHIHRLDFTVHALGLCEVKQAFALN